MTPLRLGIKIDADASGARQGLDETRQGLRGVRADAQAATAQTDSLNDTLNQQGSAAGAAAAATASAARAEADLGSAMAETARQTNTAINATRQRQSGAIEARRALAQLTEAERQAAAAAEAASKRTANANNARSAQAINQRLGVRDSFSSALRGEDIAAWGKAYEASIRTMRRELVPLAAAQDEYLAQLAKIRAAEKAGALTTIEATAAVSRNKTAFADRVKVINGTQGKGSAGSSGANAGSAWSQLRPDQKTNIGFQANDVFTSAFSGMSPLMIVAQQGPQFVQAAGGIAPTLALIAGAINPVTVGLGALTGGLVIGAAAWNSYLASTKEVETATASFGQATGTTAREVEAIAQAAAAAGTASVRSARAMEAAFVRTGQIGSEQFSGLIGLTKNFAATMQTDAATAGQQLAQLFADPGAGAAKLRSLGLLDGATARLVQRLAEQNKVQEAQTALQNGLAPRLADAASATTALGRAAEWASEKWSNLWDAIGRGVNNALGGGAQSLDAKLAEAQAQLAQYQGNSRSAQLNRALDPTGRIQGALQADIADIQEQLRARARLEQQRREAAAADRATSAAVGVATSSPANDNLQRQRQLQSDINKLQEGSGKSGLSAEEQDQITRALEAKTRALESLKVAQQRALEIDQLDIQIQAARDPVTHANLTAQRERLQLSQQEIASKELDAEVERARIRVMGEAIATTRSQIADMSAETAARKSVNDQVAAGTLSLADAERQLRLEQELRPLITASLVAEGDERKRLIALIDQTRAAYSASAVQDRRATGLSAIATQKDEIESTRLQISLVGQSEATRNRATAALQVEQRIRSQGIDTSSREAAQMRDLAQASAELSTTLARRQDAWSTFSGAGESALDSLGDALGRFSGKWSDLRSVLNNIGGDLSSTFAKMAISNPLKNALFGGNFGTVQDLGSVLGGAGGGIGAAARSVGAMTVTAGTVMINGGVAGGLGSAITGTAAANGNGGGMAGVLGLSKSFEGLNEANNSGAINSLLAGSGTPQLDARTQAWCAAYANAVLIRSGYAGTGSNLASSFLSWGKETNNPQLGDIVNLKPQVTGSSGHVGFFAGRDTAGNVLVSGGNQGDAAKTSPFPADQVVSFRTAISDATSATNTFGTGLGDAARGLTGTVRGSVADIGAAGQSLAGATDQAAVSANGFATGLGGLLENILGGIGKAGSGLFNGLGSLLGGGSNSGTVGATAGATFGFASGGRVSGPGTGTSDSILARLSDGEFVVNARAAAKHRPVLEAINQDRVGAFATGGYVSNQGSPFAAAANANQAPRQAAGGAMPIAINVNNYAGDVGVQATQTIQPDGSARIDLQLDRAVSAGLAKPGSQSAAAVQTRFGLRQRGMSG